MATVPWNDFQKCIVGVGTSYLFQCKLVNFVLIHLKLRPPALMKSMKSMNSTGFMAWFISV